MLKYIFRKEVYFYIYMKKDKEKALNLLKQKINGEIKITYIEIEKKTNYCKRQLIRLSKEIEKKDISSLLVHGLSNKPSNNSIPTKELEYIKNFKKKYPVITISQFMDVYHEDINTTTKLKAWCYCIYTSMFFPT